MSRVLLCMMLLLPFAAAVRAEEAVEQEARPDATADAPKQEGPKEISGMSILGNQEAPTSLVIVPWKSSELGDSMGISPVLDDSMSPVDKDVFLRALRYYEIRSNGNAVVKINESP